jgi:hypothetical protein
VLPEKREEEQFINFAFQLVNKKNVPNERKLRPERFLSVHSPVDVVDKSVLGLEN